jgi:hypothetical protein
MKNPIFEHWHNEVVAYFGHVHIDLSDLPIIDMDTAINAHYMRGCEPKTLWNNQRKAEERLRQLLLNDETN